MAFRIRFLLLCLVIFVSTIAPIYAQKAGPPEPTLSSQSEPSIPPPGLPVPIDDHIWLLLIMGLVLGVYFLVKKKITVSAP